MSSLDPVKIQMMQDSAQKRLGVKVDNASTTQVKKRPLDNELNIKKKLKKIVEEMDIDDQAKIVQDPRGMAIEFDGSICFGSGSTSLKPEIKRILDRVMDDLNHPTDLRPILVEGHSDNQDPVKGSSIWKKYPTAKYFGDKAKKDLLNAKELTFKNSLRIAKDLKELGINMNCAPVLDVTYDYTNNVIGDRSFSSDPKIVYELAKSFCKAHKKMKVMPVIKHIPGHGSSDKDSHKTTPIVNLDINLLNKKDFFPFKRLNKESAAMVAHIIYNRIDNKLACYSKIIIEKIIRKKIGFTGLLFSDDILVEINRFGNELPRIDEKEKKVTSIFEKILKRIPFIN